MYKCTEKNNLTFACHHIVKTNKHALRMNSVVCVCMCTLFVYNGVQKYFSIFNKICVVVIIYFHFAPIAGVSVCVCCYYFKFFFFVNIYPVRFKLNLFFYFFLTNKVSDRLFSSFFLSLSLVEIPEICIKLFSLLRRSKQQSYMNSKWKRFCPKHTSWRISVQDEKWATKQIREKYFREFANEKTRKAKKSEKKRRNRKKNEI